MHLRSVEVSVFLLLAAIAVGDGIRILIQHAAKLRAYEAGGYLILIGLLLAGMTVLYGLSEPEARWEAGQGGRWVMTAALILVGYTLLLPVLGYVLGTTLAFIIYLRVFGTYRWTFILSFSCVGSIGSAWLWDWLSIMLPTGPLSWP
jgi:hypothetical protein